MSNLILTNQQPVSEQQFINLLEPMIQRAVTQAMSERTPSDPVQRFSQREMSQRRGISQRTLIAWRKQGLLDYEEVNSRIYLTDQQIDEAFQKSSKR